MKAGDALLLELARQANVRPTVIFHAYHYRRQMGERYSDEGYASFTGLPLTHVSRVMEILANVDKPRAKRRAASVLSEGWAVPEEWLMWAQTEKGWSRDVTETVAARFKDYWLSKGKGHADWQATWRNWVRSPYSPESVVRAPDSVEWTPERRKAYAKGLR